MTARSQEVKDKISANMIGNKNAVGNPGNPKKKKYKGVDHTRIQKRFTKAYNKYEYNEDVAHSAALMMFTEASQEKQIEYMKRVRKVLK